MPAQSSRKRSSPNSTDAQPILQMACLLQCYSVFQVAQYSNCIGTSSGEGSDFSLSTNKLVLPILYNQEGRRRTVSGDRFLDRSGAHLIVNTLQNSHNFKSIDVKWGTLTCPWWEYLFHKNRQKLQTTSPHPHACYQTLPVWVRVLQRKSQEETHTQICCCCSLTEQVAQLCLAFCNPMDCSLPCSSVHGFPRQEYWNGLSFPSPGDLPDPGIGPESPALECGFFTTTLLGRPIYRYRWCKRMEVDIDDIDVGR